VVRPRALMSNNNGPKEAASMPGVPQGRAAHRPPAARPAFWMEAVSTSHFRYRGLMAGTALALVAAIGSVDYLTGYEISFLPFYFLPVCLATAALGWTFGVVTAAASVATWIIGDFAAGARYSNPFVVGWNALIAFAVYLVVVRLLSGLLAAHREVEERVRERTTALTAEIAERERLERAVIAIGERERCAIGRDLHDGLGQHLTGTALVAQAHRARLSAQQSDEVADARKIVALVEEAIDQTRKLAKGLLLVEIAREGLPEALRDLAAVTSRQFGVACTFHGDDAAAFGDSATTSHLYRIAQEAVRNAVRHGQAKCVEIELSHQDGAVVLTVKDNGVGLPPPSARTDGLGLQIMAHRAGLIGASFRIAAQPGGGTLVACRLATQASSP
jgi:signal transduction histidine kinase